jgi:hypothetical protein
MTLVAARNFAHRDWHGFGLRAGARLLSRSVIAAGDKVDAGTRRGVKHAGRLIGRPVVGGRRDEVRRRGERPAIGAGERLRRWRGPGDPGSRPDAVRNAAAARSARTSAARGRRTAGAARTAATGTTGAGTTGGLAAADRLAGTDGLIAAARSVATRVRPAPSPTATLRGAGACGARNDGEDQCAQKQRLHGGPRHLGILEGGVHLEAASAESATALRIDGQFATSSSVAPRSS